MRATSGSHRACRCEPHDRGAPASSRLALSEREPRLDPRGPGSFIMGSGPLLWGGAFGWVGFWLRGFRWYPGIPTLASESSHGGRITPVRYSCDGWCRCWSYPTPLAHFGVSPKRMVLRVLLSTVDGTRLRQTEHFSNLFNFAARSMQHPRGATRREAPGLAPREVRHLGEAIRRSTSSMCSR